MKSRDSAFPVLLFEFKWVNSCTQITPIPKYYDFNLSQKKYVCYSDTFKWYGVGFGLKYKRNTKRTVSEEASCSIPTSVGKSYKEK